MCKYIDTRGHVNELQWFRIRYSLILAVNVALLIRLIHQHSIHRTLEVLLVAVQTSTGEPIGPWLILGQVLFYYFQGNFAGDSILFGSRFSNA